MTSTILVPLDGSPLAQRALPYADAIARRSRGRLILLRVLVPTAEPGQPLVQEPDARTLLEATARPLRGSGLDVDLEVTSTLLGSVADGVLAEAGRHRADLLVLSTHGRGGLGRLLYGSVADELIRRAATPLLLVPPTCDRAWPDPPGRLVMLVGHDGSALADEAMGPIFAAAGRVGADLVLLRVLPLGQVDAAAWVLCEDQPEEEATAARTLGAVAERARATGLRAATRIERGLPVTRIAAVATQERADVVALATHGRSGLARVVLGSVATEVLRRAAMPVLLVRPAGLREQSPQGAEESGPAGSHAAHPGPVRILVALDLSAPAEAALGPAAVLARASGAELMLLNVFIPIVEFGRITADSGAECLEYVRTERQMYLHRLAAMLPDLTVRTWVEACRPSEEVDECIARFAQDWGASFVVMASESVAHPLRSFLGSTTQGVLRLSPCPVVVVRAEDPARSVDEPMLRQVPATGAR